MIEDSLEFDVVIVGAGPAGLACAIHLKQLAKSNNLPLRVAILEKAAEIGGHIISGAVFEPRALNELIPDWKNKGAPLTVPTTSDSFLFLSSKHHFKFPTPPQMKNRGNYIISLERLCQWLAKEAEKLGVEIFPGFAGTEFIYSESGVIKGVKTNPVGIDRKGQKKTNFQPGVDIPASYTLLAEGCRGSLSKILIEKFELRKNADPQTYGIGFKELWEIEPHKHHLGKVIHSVGFPLNHKTYGGSFIYHFENNLLSIGFVVGLDYQNPYLDPFEEFQRFKLHPYVSNLLKGGKRISYGARALNEGGFQSIPQLIFPGGALIGCAAGFLNVPKIKGSHTAMKSGMLAAEAVFEAFKENNKSDLPPLLTDYEKKIKSSWIYKELKKARNVRPAFRFGLWPGLVYAAIDTYLFRGHAPWTFHYKPDHLSLKFAKQCKPFPYPKPDNVFTFDKLSSVALSNTFHEDDQPPHLILHNKHIPIDFNLALYDAPEQRYCPAQVYEILKNEQGYPYLQINAQNCIHCKTCDIKDPMQNITWVPPEGGGGPNYSNM